MKPAAFLLHDYTEKEILELKRRLAECNIDTTHLVYMPIVPMTGIEKSFFIGELFGMKIAALISPSDD